MFAKIGFTLKLMGYFLATVIVAFVVAGAILMPDNELLKRILNAGLEGGIGALGIILMLWMGWFVIKLISFIIEAAFKSMRGGTRR